MFFECFEESVVLRTHRVLCAMAHMGPGHTQVRVDTKDIAELHKELSEFYGKVSPAKAHNIKGILCDYAMRGGGRAQRQALNKDLQATYGQSLASVHKDGPKYGRRSNNADWSQDDLDSEGCGGCLNFWQRSRLAFQGDRHFDAPSGMSRENAKRSPERQLVDVPQSYNLLPQSPALKWDRSPSPLRLVSVQSPSGTIQVKLQSRTPSPSPRGEAWIRPSSARTVQSAHSQHDYRHLRPQSTQSTPRRVVVSPSLCRTTARVAAGPGLSRDSRATAWQVGFGHVQKQACFQATRLLSTAHSSNAHETSKEPASKETAQSRPSTPLMGGLLQESKRRCEQSPPQLDSHEQDRSNHREGVREIARGLRKGGEEPAGRDAALGEKSIPTLKILGRPQVQQWHPITTPTRPSLQQQRQRIHVVTSASINAPGSIKSPLPSEDGCSQSSTVPSMPSSQVLQLPPPRRLPNPILLSPYARQGQLNPYRVLHLEDSTRPSGLQPNFIVLC